MDHQVLRSKYLLAAKYVLEVAGKPLSVIEIMDEINNDRLLNVKNINPAKQLKTRLTESISKLGALSPFQKTGPDRYFLRDKALPEFIEIPKQRELPDEIVVCVPRSVIESIVENRASYFKEYEDILNLLKKSKALKFVKRAEAEARLDLVQLIAYVQVLTHDGNIMGYQRGKASNAHPELLRGNLCIGFGGHILNTDVEDLFGMDDLGIANAVCREIYEEIRILKLSSYTVEGLIVDRTTTEGLKHLGIVLKTILPPNFNPAQISKEQSINGVKEYTVDELHSQIHRFEFWSQLIIRDYPTNATDILPVNIVPKRKPVRGKHILIVGEIAVGKTTIIKKLLEINSAFIYVSVRECLIEILDVEDFGTGDRSNFQELAQNFITSSDDPEQLAKMIANRQLGGKHLLIDGIRNISTILNLKKLLTDIIIINIDCPKDKALNNYVNNSKNRASYSEFISAREHSTEKELFKIKGIADAYLYNGGHIDDAVKILNDWLGFNS